MQAHPVPQNIMQVEFQLVGNLTLRQFGYIAGAGILAWIIFVSPVLSFIKIPIATLVALLGLAIAFLPINDMRLENWIVAFFKAIYSPTRRVWLKQVEDIDFLTDTFTRLVARPALIHTTRAANRARLDLYLHSTKPQIKNTLDEFEDRKLSSLNFQIEAPASLTTIPNLSPETLPITAPAAPESRRVEESSKVSPSIASKVIFTPVATIKLPDKNIFIKSVSNKRSHFLHPAAAGQGTILLPIRGERLFQVSQQMRQKLNQYVKPFSQTKTETQVLMAAEKNPTPPRPQITSAMMPNLPEANRESAKPRPNPNLNPYQPPQVAPKPPLAPLPNPVERPIINVFVNQSSTPITEPPAAVKTETGTQTPSSSENTINVVAKPIFNQPLDPPFAEKSPEPVKNAQEDAGTTSLKENIKQLTTQESQLQGEVERYKTQEQYLTAQLALSQKDRTNEVGSTKVKELEEQLMKMQQEKEHAESRAQRLEGLINQINTTQPKTVLNREIITPQAAQPTQTPQIHVVSPRRAEGKMAPPMTTVPNVINGVVKDVNGLILAETIIVVKDKNDEPVRALKANKVGQFAISTALPNGTYLMEIEKEGYEFDYIEIKLNGEILAPIEIRSRGGS